MQIRVKCNCGDGKCPEWAIVELQGVVSQSAVGDRIHDLEIGRLCCSSSSSEVKPIFQRSYSKDIFFKPSYTFTIGYHELSGKMIRLKKPLLVLKKKVAIDVAVPEFPVSSAVQLEVVGVIRQKILFKTRPKALISGPQPKEKRPT